MSVAELEAREIQLEAPSGLWSEARYRLVRNPTAVLGAFFVAVFVVCAIFAPLTVDRRHVLRNAMLPVSTIIGLQTGLLLSGAVLTETVFAYPGIGSWLRDAIFNSDYPVLQGGILFLAVVFVLVNLLVDISYAIINPRIRYS